MADHQIVGVAPPSVPVYRISVAGADPFGPPPWERVGGNRYDDPEQDFRIVYCASKRAGAFGESLARYRHSLTLLARLQTVADSEESFDDATAELVAASDEQRGVVPFDWRFTRQLGSTLLDPALIFADITEAETLSYLRAAIAPIAVRLHLSDFDLSTVLGPKRGITQACARHIRDLRDAAGGSRFAGIRYPSRLNQDWICWAVFEDRLKHTLQNIETPISIDDAGFREAARVLDLSVETIRGQGNVIRP